MKNFSLEIIEDSPVFPAPLDQLLLSKMAAKSPEVAHLLNRVAEETQYREWLVERVVAVNNAMVCSHAQQSEILDKLNEINNFNKEYARRMDSVETQGKATAATVLDWVIKFKSPLAMIAALFGIVVVAVVTAITTHFIK